MCQRVTIIVVICSVDLSTSNLRERLVLKYQIIVGDKIIGHSAIMDSPSGEFNGYKSKHLASKLYKK